MKLLRQVRRFLALPSKPVGDAPFRRQTEAWREAWAIVRAYYLIHLLFAAQALSWIDRVRGSAPLLLWPVGWMSLAGIETSAIAVHIFAIAAALFAALWPHVRVLRALSWLGFFEMLALRSSFGYVSHGWHAWLWVGLCFVFLPNRDPVEIESRRCHRQSVLIVVWLAQALLLLFYSLTGGWKLVGAAVQAAQGESHSFSPDALAIQIARSLLMQGSTSTFGAFFIEHQLLGWPFYLLAIYIELFAFVVAFRPAIQRFWGICLSVFHIFIFLTFHLDFLSQFVLVALLFFRSPFAPPRSDWRDMLCAVPLFGTIRRRRGSAMA